MRTERGQLILGIPAMQLRTLMRSWGGYREGHDFLRQDLGMETTAAKAFWSALLAEGYIQREAALGPSTEAFSRTIKGAALAGASAAPPLKRHVVEN
jgi:hypothetical protein